MSSSKWSKQEDERLSKIVGEATDLKWKNIARLYKLHSGFPKRSSKECHRRWVNFLDPSINYQKWTSEEDKILLDAHIQYGNQWALIEGKLPGRPNLSIKNHFYSMMRKGLRKINKFIKDFLGSSYVRQLSSRFISKVILLSSNTQLKPPQPSVIQAAIQIKSELFREALMPEKDQQCQLRLRNLVNIIIKFNKETRRHTKQRILNSNKVKLQEKIQSQLEDRNVVESASSPKESPENQFIADSSILLYNQPFINNLGVFSQMSPTYLQFHFTSSITPLLSVPYPSLFISQASVLKYS